MKNSKYTSFIVLSGVVVLCVFAYIVAYNIIPKNKESNSYYVKVGETMSAKIESININDGILTLTTSGDTIEYCAKTTRSTPIKDSICWKKIENNMASIQIFDYKEYYIWIKDNSNNISNPMSIDANKY